MTSLRHSTQIDQNQTQPDYPDFLQKLIPEFKPHVLQRHIDKTTTIGGVKLSIVVHSVLSTLLRGMVWGESLLSPIQTRCFPSIKSIKESSKACESSARHALRELENAGVSTIIETTNPKTGKNNNNIYKIGLMAFFEWALAQVEGQEEKDYIVGCMDKLREAKRPTRLSILQGKQGFLTRQKNQDLQELVNSAESSESGYADFQSKLSAVRKKTEGILSIVKETESGDIQKPLPMEPAFKSTFAKEGVPETPSGYEIQKGEASTRYTHMASTRYTRSTHKNKTYITTHVNTTSTAENLEEKLEADVPISSRDMKELMGAYTAIMGRKVPSEEQKLFVSKMLNVGTSVEEVKANIKLLQEDAVCRATTTSFTRMAVKPDQVRWWLESQRTSLENSFERGNLLGNPHIRGKFQTEPQAIREVFSKIDPILTQLLPDTATDELKRKFLDTLSGSEIRSFILLGEDISLPFKKWEAGTAAEVLQAETPAVAPRIEVESKIESVTTETTEQEPTESVELPEPPATSAVTELHEAEPRKDNQKLQEMRNSIVLHLYKVFGTRLKSDVIFSFCKILEGVNYGFSEKLLNGQLELDFAKFTAVHNEKTA